MVTHQLAGKRPLNSQLANIPRLVSSFYVLRPDPAIPEQRVKFGTSGHRGTSLAASFNEAHILAISQAVCDYRKLKGIDGPLFMGIDTHALSEPALSTAIEVLVANEVNVRIAPDGQYTPTPVISHAILTYNRGTKDRLADGIVMTPSHNPPEDGGFKYNPPHGGPAGTAETSWIEERANRLLEESNRSVKRIDIRQARESEWLREHDFVTPYVSDLEAAVDLAAVARAGLRIGVDPMGGSGIGFWEPLRERYGLDLEVVNDEIDPRFSFMALDHDGVIRMDCSSPYAMARLIELKDRFDIAFGNDPDYDRHGIVSRKAGLMNPNHYLSVAVWYLFQNRTEWSREVAVGKTLVSSSMIDRVTASLGRELVEVPVGFKWFVEGLLEGRLGLAGEESAGASFLRKDGTVWTTDKDGIVMDLLAAEIMAVTEKDPSEIYADLTRQFGDPVYRRIDAPATPAQKEALKALRPSQLKAEELAGEKVIACLDRAPGHGESIGGIKVVTENAWFAARPSGTEEIYKIYAESFRGPDHLEKVQEEAQALIARAFKEAGI
ncbi:MAG TPA: phosphoglucomutase (alpha-D-glucose-1,6-bisphosphate-dependent) [Acidobacteriota bacterium]|nr:phosphoglucomutase (alpha-D-glucose-1,6-bisphosphate-dependent) [Acidobacteriota bacterium]